MKRKIRKIYLFMVLIVLLFTTVDADETKKVDEADSFILKMLNDYYYAIEQYSEIDISKYIDNEFLEEYILNKVKAKTYRKIIYGKDEIENLKISYDFISKASEGNEMYYTIYSNISFNYKGADFESGYGQDIRIVVKKEDEQYKIKDFYMYDDDYDMELRSYELNMSNAKIIHIKELNRETILKQRELNEKIFKFYDNIKNESYDETKQEDNNDNTSIKSSLHSLNKSSMVSWANTNYKKSNPTSGNSSLSSYYDFSNISGNYDCTNFVSHSILAGGSNIYQTNTSGISSTGWYYKGINNRSSSWSGVQNLYNFLVNNTTKGPVGYKISYTNIYAPSGNFPYKAGDILQFHNGSIWRHSTLIVGYIEVSGSTTNLEAIVTGRSSSGSYNYKQRQSSIYSGNSRRVIVMKGYYQ